MTPSPAVFPSSRTFAVGLLGVVALTVYGSLVPFEYQARSFDDAVHAFEYTMRTRVRLESRSDGVANVLLGLPLGFCLLGAMRADRPGRVAAAVYAVVLLPVCTAFAAAVEFSQLWFPKRTCAGSDVFAQTLGSATGMLAWVLSGQRSTDWVRGMWATDRFGGKAGRVLSVYLAVLLAIQVLPFDVTTSPRDVYKRLRDEKGVTYRPFAEWDETAANPTKRVQKVVAWLWLAGAFLPVGILVAGLPGFWRTCAGFPMTFWAAVALGIGMEAVQVPIQSRHGSATDVLVEAGSVLLGWAGAVAARSRGGPGVCFGFALGWVMLLATAGWYPFDFNLTVAGRVTAANLIPFAAIETKQYLMLLNEVLEVVVLYAPLGAAVTCMIRATTPWSGVLAAVTVAAGIELGQVGLVSRTPATTDVLLAALGGGIGSIVWHRLQGKGPTE